MMEISTGNIIDLKVTHGSIRLNNSIRKVESIGVYLTFDSGINTHLFIKRSLALRLMNEINKQFEGDTLLKKTNIAQKKGEA